MTSLRIKAYAMFAAGRLVFRCWRLSRKFGVPFEDVFEVEMATLEEVMFDDYRREKELHTRSQTRQAGQEPKGDA